VAKTKDKEPLLVLDDKSYFKEDMDDKQLRICDHLRNVADKQNSNFFMSEQLEITKNGLIQMFRESLIEEPDQATK
jgi:UDP-N-acetylglucosamine transferase subunit ALG13